MPTDFRAFYEQHLPLVRNVAYQIAGRSLIGPALDDLVQEAFVKIWRGLLEFRNEAEITSWVYRVTSNAALDHLKSIKRRREVSDDEGHEVFDDRSSVEDRHAARELVEQALELLSHDQRAVVVLVLIHERPLEEVAETLSIPLGTVKSRVHAGKDVMSQFLESKGVRAHG